MHDDCLLFARHDTFAIGCDVLCLENVPHKSVTPHGPPIKNVYLLIQAATLINLLLCDPSMIFEYSCSKCGNDRVSVGSHMFEHRLSH